MPHSEDIQQLVDAELATIDDPIRRAALAALLVTPKSFSLKWGYGMPGERYQCWLVGISPDGKTRLVYCEKGFGPSYPWGIVGIAQEWMGMDCQWHVGLEHAAIGAGALPAPSNYEVP